MNKEFKKFTLMDETPSAPASDKTIMIDDIEKLELDYYKELEERREVAKNFQGQVAGRHPDMFGHSEIHHMVRGYLEGYNKAKESLYTEEQVREAYEYGSNASLGVSKTNLIQSLKQGCNK
jgi:hypothetical protein